MRIRKLLAPLLVAGFLVVAVPGVAGASGGDELTHCVTELAEKIESGKVHGDSAVNSALDDCRKSPNFLLPPLPEIIWTAIAFAVVAGALMKFALPALKKGMKAREDRIRDDLTAAENARVEAETLRADYELRLAEARGEAGRIVEEARQSADDVRRDLVARAEADAAELRSRAADDVRLATERAMADLHTRVAELSVELAEKVVERNLDRDTQIALIENYINEVGSR